MVRILAKLPAALILGLTLPASPAVSQQMKGENLLLTVPDNYIAAFTDGNAKTRIAEFVPKGQTVGNWLEMLTVNVFFGGIEPKPTEFAKRFVARYSSSCTEGTGRIIRHGREHDYQFVFFAAICGQNPKTGKPEWVLAKAIKGNDSFYLVQKAWKYTPNEAEINTWSRYLGGINLCDSRSDKAPCPVVNN